MQAMEIGQIVESAKGRDQGRLMVVVGVINEDYVLLCDGDLRPLDKPKKKKTKHLIPKQECISSLRDKITDGKQVLDSEIRKVLKSLRDQGLDAPCKEGNL